MKGEPPPKFTQIPPLNKTLGVAFFSPLIKIKNLSRINDIMLQRGITDGMIVTSWGNKNMSAQG